MKTYRELYFFLLHVTEQVLRALEEENKEEAVRLLILAQRQVEEAILLEDFQSGE